ncbi:PH domain-containing protein [Priestia taiwanensis]|uniref:Membrane protein n=1 Tax=Priestia taiwanensis TaxID=1347902 RepID=A0A917AIL2_9BACI|nr:PH domain-containing protein [Priestia taiwanensis]MBM7361436.1 putative membrane protein [Priestia taiwanensis]GGE54136.1 membrane protein [Priestia taiwanensis]
MYNKRQHPIVIVSKFLGNLKSAIIPLIPVFILSGNAGSWLQFGILGAILLFSLYDGFITWCKTIYSITDDELHVKSGWLFKKEKFIKRSRVQSITTQAGILQQLFNLEKLTIETAGGKEPEVELQAITQEDALAIRMALKKDNDAAEQLEGTTEQQQENIEEPKTTFTLQPKEVLIGGMTSGGIGLLFSAMLAIIGKLHEVIPDEAFDYAFNYASSLFGEVSIMVLVIVVFIALIVAWIISISYFALSYGNFSITKHNDELHIVRGILEKKETSIKQHRIQGITLVEGLLRQPFGYMSVYIEAVGTSGDDKDKKILIHPFIHKSKLTHFLNEMTPSFIYTPKTTALPKRTCDRWIFHGTATMMILGAAIALPLTYFTEVTQEIAAFLSLPTFSIVTIFILSLALLGGIYSYIMYRSSSFALSTKLLQLSKRVLAKRTSIIQKKNIQSLGYKESYFQNRKDLRTLVVHILSSESDTSLSLEDMEKNDVKQIYHWFSRSPKQEAKS